jgi:hypothetical protein
MNCDLCCKEIEEGKCQYQIKQDGYDYVVCSDCNTKIVEKEIDKEIQPIVEKLCNLLNGKLSEREMADALYRNFIREHRYLQGCFFTTLFIFFEKYQKADHDARNKGAVTCAKKWYEAL